LKKKVPVVTVAEPEEVAQLAGVPLEATVALADLAAAVKDGLLGMCVDVGLMVMAQVMDDELTRRIGPKHAKLAERSANWHGTTTGSVVLGGRLLSVERPRGRTTDGTELELDSWAVFSSKDLLDQLTAERVLAGVATRRQVDVAEPLGLDIEDQAKGTGRSSVSRRWKRATEAALAELMAKDLSGLEVVVLMVDGIEVAGQCCVAALVVCADGTKVPVGLWLGDTENKTVVTALLADLVARGAEHRSRRACGYRRGQGLSGRCCKGLRRKSPCTTVYFAQKTKCEGPSTCRGRAQGRPPPGVGFSQPRPNEGPRRSKTLGCRDQV
jgi:hypothetical protein